MFSMKCLSPSAAGLLLFISLIVSACGTTPVEAVLPPVSDVQAMVSKGACGNCHEIPRIDGAIGNVGPSWCEPAKEFQEGAVDLDFLRESILEPNAEIGAGFAANVMPQNFGDQFTDHEVDTIVIFIATLKCN